MMTGAGTGRGTGAGAGAGATVVGAAASGTPGVVTPGISLNAGSFFCAAEAQKVPAVSRPRPVMTARWVRTECRKRWLFIDLWSCGIWVLLNRNFNRAFNLGVGGEGEITITSKTESRPIRGGSGLGNAITFLASPSLVCDGHGVRGLTANLR